MTKNVNEQKVRWSTCIIWWIINTRQSAITFILFSYFCVICLFLKKNPVPAILQKLFLAVQNEAKMTNFRSLKI